jgi:hypothetical protein
VEPVLTRFLLRRTERAVKKFMKPGRRYFIINLDEPYAPEVYEILKRGQMAKGPEHWPEGDVSFEEWKRQTFAEDGEER